MFLPIRTDAPIRHRPWMNIALIVTNVVVFLAQQKFLVGERAMMFHLVPDALTLSSFFTYQFVHGSVMHLVGNMIFLYIFGNNVNDRLGHVGYLAFYLAGGVVAGIGHTLTSTAPVLGASGSVSAVTGAFLVLFPYSHTTVVYFYFLIGSFEVKSLYLILFFFLKDVIFNFVGTSNVAYMAHVAGTMFGVGVCFSLLVVGLLPRDLFDVLGLVDRWNRRRRFRGAVAVGGFNPFGQLTSSKAGGGRDRAIVEKVPPAMQRTMDLRAAIFEAMNEGRLSDAADLYSELKVIDPSQALPLRNQMELATYLGQQQRYPQAAEAYESLLKVYPTAPEGAQIELMLGLIYARYLKQHDRAAGHLRIAIERLNGGNGTEMAKEELARIEEIRGGEGGMH